MRTYAGRLLPQLIALAAIVVAISIVFPGFLNLQIQNGRLYGSMVDILNRGAPVVLLAIGMTVVIATKGIDLSVGAVMAICGAVAASLITSGHSLPRPSSPRSRSALSAASGTGFWSPSSTSNRSSRLSC